MIQFRWDIIKYLANSHKIYIVCPLDKENYELNYQHRNVFFFNITFCRSINVFKDVVTLIQFARIIKKINPDVIFSYSLKSSFFSMLSNWKITNYYFITGLGSSLINKYKFFIDTILYILTHLRKLIIKQQDFFIFLNNDDKNYFIQKSFCQESYTKVFPGEGVNLEFFKFSPMQEHQNISFLFIGRLIKDKGILELMEACKELKNNHIPYKCTVIAPYDQYNPTSLHTMDVSDFQAVGIEYLSFVDDVRTYIEACDVFILPSYSEGLPRVLLESMAIGRAIITTDVHGCKELVSKDNGLVVKAKDPQSLYDAMLNMSRKTKQELSQLGLAGYKKVKAHYSLSKVINNYQTLIENRVNKE
jgi:glycosyltransferase involved in cell wall biosynthesis